MKSREICVWLDERWYDALSRHLKDETVEDKLGDYLDQLINELVPEQEYSRISQELWQEDRQARQELEAARKFAIFRIRESGQDRCLQVERPLEFLDAARLLRSYLRGERGASSFEQMLHQAEEITPEAFEDMVLVRMENTGKVTGTFELDFDKREFSAVNVMDGWQTFKIKDVSAAVYYATRSSRVSLADQWAKFTSHLEGKQIEPESFAPVEIGGLRPLEKGDILCIDGPFYAGRELKFRLDLSGYGVQKEVLNLMVDCSKPENSLEITCGYDAARQGISDELGLTLRQKNGMVRHDFFYPLMEEERDLLLKIVEQFCQQQTGKTLNDYYAQLDMEREAPPELTAGTKRLPVDAVSFTDEITECDGKLSFYIPINFDPDAVFGTNVASAVNDDWLNVYANFDWKTGRIDSALTVCLVCSDGHEFEFSYPLTPAEQVQLWNQMDAYCHQQNGQSLGETRTALLREQAEEGLEIRL